ncbi:MAG: ABC transporter ATP-binding protein [Chromatiales bacterium]|nr:ABC transporter ATP-binding protein [Chromatiales bacterium]
MSYGTVAPLVELQGVEKRYDGVHALRGIDLRVEPGEILGLLGHNGAGKTTTMKLIMGVLQATAGTVRLFGHSPIGGDADQLRRHLGYLPENVSFYQHLSGREVLDYFARLKGCDLKENSRLLERVGLGDASHRRVGTYSKGMRQRLGLAQAVLGAPRLLVLDEPTAGLDPEATGDFYTMIDEVREQGCAVLLSSHVLPGIERHVDRVAILGSGRLLGCGSLARLSADAALPSTIRISGDWAGVDWQQRLAGHPVEFRHINGHRMELTIGGERKLELMRLLLSESGISDIEVSQPTLNDLYAYYNRSGVQEVAS